MFLPSSAPPMAVSPSPLSPPIFLRLSCCRRQSFSVSLVVTVVRHHQTVVAGRFTREMEGNGGAGDEKEVVVVVGLSCDLERLLRNSRDLICDLEWWGRR
ncbi:hypothetical protein Hanom_Chr04g00370051 [Helianthus anomalus]